MGFEITSHIIEGALKNEEIAFTDEGSALV